MLGLCLHYVISIVAAAIYAEAAVRNQTLRERWLVGGTVFGVIAYAAMNLVVVPLSYAANPDFSLVVVVKELLAHTIMFGIPIAEHLCNLSGLPPSGFRFHAAPVKFRGVGTFPVRAYAVVD